MNKHAFLVGVDAYDRATISPVPFAVRDAESVGAVLRERCGFEAVVLCNPTGAEAARALDERIALIEDPDDLFCFFFAGHGVVYENESYLLLKDAYPEAGMGMYQLSALRRQFARLRSRNRLVFLDCCRNDPRAGKGDAANLMSGRLSAALDGLGSRDIGPAAAGAGGEYLTLLLKACREGERAYESEAWRHGAFSWFLKKGLEGAAWRNGELKAHELCRYVAAGVRDWARGEGLRQQPDFQQNGTAENIVLAGEPEGASGAAAEPVVVVSPPPEMVECPLCGKLNPLPGTFRCRDCGRDKLCLRHQDERSFLCAPCEEKRRKPEPPPERSDKGLVLGLLFLVLAGVGSFIFLEVHKKQEVKKPPQVVEQPAPPEVATPSQVVEEPAPPEVAESPQVVEVPAPPVVAKPSQVVEEPALPEVAKPSQVVEQQAPPEVAKPPQIVEEQAPPEVAKSPQVVEEPAPPEVAKPSQVVEKPVAQPTGETWKNSIGMEFVLIPAGSFQMGCTSEAEPCDNNEKPRHKVTISRPFYLGKYEVTQRQWQAMMGNNPSRFKGADRPVGGVSWDDAQEFIRRLNAKEGHNRYRLPTEAEWEYAVRAGGETVYSFGDYGGHLKDYAWFGQWGVGSNSSGKYFGNSGGRTHPVGEKKPNAWGLYDMHGNVWEWVSDWYGAYGAEAVVDPQGPSSGKARVLRSCTRWSGSEKCRSATRDSGEPNIGRPYGYYYDDIGFRLALSPGH